MTERDPFSHLLSLAQARETAEAARTEETARIQAIRYDMQARQRLETAAFLSYIAERDTMAVSNLVDAKNDRDRLRQGTPPEQVLGQNDARLSREFIEHAKTKSFSNAVLLDRHEGQSFSGYGIAVIGSYSTWAQGRTAIEEADPMSPWMLSQFPRKKPSDYPSFYNVYLCSDGLLRYYPGPDSPDQKVMSDLPIDDKGVIIKPTIGKLLKVETHPRVELVEAVSIGTQDGRVMYPYEAELKNGKYMVRKNIPGNTTYYFESQRLDKILVDYALKF